MFSLMNHRQGSNINCNNVFGWKTKPKNKKPKNRNESTQLINVCIVSRMSVLNSDVIHLIDRGQEVEAISYTVVHTPFYISWIVESNEIEFVAHKQRKKTK